MQNEPTPKEIGIFLKQLKSFDLTLQQRSTLRGQAKAGDLQGAQKGLITILERRVKGK